MTPTTVRDLLTSLLDEAVMALETTDGAAVPPERQFIGHGIVAWDCDLLSAYLVRITPKLLDPKANNCVVVMVASMAVVLLRCVPAVDGEGNPPSADRLNEANRQLAIDGPAIQKHLTRAWSEGSWPAGMLCRNVTWGALEPFAPAGGLAGWRLQVDVQLT